MASYTTDDSFLLFFFLPSFTSAKVSPHWVCFQLIDVCSGSTSEDSSADFLIVLSVQKRSAFFHFVPVPCGGALTRSLRSTYSALSSPLIDTGVLLSRPSSVAGSVIKHSGSVPLRSPPPPPLPPRAPPGSVISRQWDQTGANEKIKYFYTPPLLPGRAADQYRHPIRRNRLCMSAN